MSNLLMRRNSYINRVYELERKDNKERLIAKFYRPGRWTKGMILEEHGFVKDLFAKENHVIPPLEFKGKTLFDAGGILFTVFPKKGGRALDEFDKEGWINIGRVIGKIHLVSSKEPETKRILWKPSVATAHHMEVIDKAGVLPEDFKTSFDTTVSLLIKTGEPFFEGAPLIKLHGDIHRGNFIHRPGEGTYIVDFDDMCTGPAVQDMWMMLPDTVENSSNEISWFIQGYETFRPFPYRSLELVPYLRAMRMVHFASWCAVQKDDSDFATHFPEWGTKKYWGQLIRDIRGAFE